MGGRGASSGGGGSGTLTKSFGEFKSNGRTYKFFTRKSDGRIRVQVERLGGRLQDDADAIVRNNKVEFYSNRSNSAGYKLTDLRKAMSGG